MFVFRYVDAIIIVKPSGFYIIIETGTNIILLALFSSMSKHLSLSMCPNNGINGVKTKKKIFFLAKEKLFDYFCTEFQTIRK